MSKALVIVESPAKARTISKFLTDDYIVEASIGHIRDLPRKASEVPESKKKENWADLGVDVDNDFRPLYIIPDEKKEQVKRLKNALKKADVLYLATDEDREGESISWHLVEVLRPKVPVHRLVFHEITQKAISNALEKVRTLNLNLVHAQETRRIVDRLYGYKVSPLLWNKLKKRTLSAGRVQSVALRMVVERERQRMAFVAAQWWSIDGLFSHTKGSVKADLFRWQGKSTATGASFDSKGKLKKSDHLVLTEELAQQIRTSLQGKQAVVESLTKRNFTEKPSPPFITSTLQQEAIRKLRWTAKRTMSVAQRLYENGWITYMRTDSVFLSSQAMKASRTFIKKQFGAEYLPEKARVYQSTTKNAQEAHEAIRPAGESFHSLEKAHQELSAEEAKLYELIWKRTVASQMKNATGSRLRLVLQAGEGAFSASGKSYTFQGFRKVYIASNGQEATNDGEKVLPPLEKGDVLGIDELNLSGHQTKPPARLTEASLVKALEEKGVGRPSTYAAIIDNILRRGYIFKRGSALVPTFTAFVVISLLESHLQWLVDYEFTAKMETLLDGIARGEEEQNGCLSDFYLGDEGLLKTLEQAYSSIDREQSGIELCQTEEGESIEVRCGRFGEFLQLGDVIAYLPEGMPPDEMTREKAIELIEEKKKGAKELGNDPETQKMIYLAKGPFGYYIQLGEPEEVPKKRGKGTKTIAPKRVSLLRGMHPEDIGLEEALALLSLPRTLGETEVSGKQEPIIAANGRYGPYVKQVKKTASIPPTLSVLTITLEEAVELLAKSKKGSAILRELGTDSKNKSEIVVKSGRYGPYVTDGKNNASIPKAMDIESITLEQAIELIAKKASKPKKPRTRKARKKS